MATKKVTITLDEDQLERIRALVEAGTTSSVSGFVQHAVGVALDDVAGWGAMLADALGDTGGELSRGKTVGRRGARHQGTGQEPGRVVAGITMDTGGLIAVDRNDRRIVVLLAHARETGSRITVPASALAQAVRQPERQVRLAGSFGSRRPTSYLWTGLMPPTWGGCLLRAGRPMLWMPML